MNGTEPQRLKEILAPTLPNLWELAATALGVSVLIWLTFRIRAWFRDDDAGTGRNNDLLTDLRELQREGGLSEEEFRLIKSRLLKGANGVSAAPAKPAEVVSDSPVSTVNDQQISTDTSLQGRSEAARPGE